MKKLIIPLLILLTLPAIAQKRLTYENRIDSVQTFFENLAGNRNFSSSLAMILSEKNRNAGLRMLDTLLAEIGYIPINRFRLTALYLHAKQVLTPEHVDWIKEIWAEDPILPPHEEFEELIYYTSLMLMSEQFPDMRTWFNGRSAAENRKDARDYILHWMHATTHHGQQMYDSPSYAPAMIVSMLLIADFSADAELARKTRVMVSWLLADFALDYLEGQYTGSHGKESNESAMFPIVSDMSQFGWMYFGDGYQLYGLEQYFASLAKYEPDPEIVELAQNRKHAYESYELKRSGTRIRDDAKATYPIQKYTYMAPLYSVGSIPGGLNSISEQHSWDVTWVSAIRNSTLFSLHPYAAPEAVAEFRPYPADNAYKFYAGSDNYYATASKSVGGSPFESIFQYKNTVLALYNIPDDLPRYPFIAAFLPLKPNKLDIDTNRSGWITMDVGDVYVALYPLKPYNIFPEPNSQRLYSRGRNNGFIVQVAGKSEIGAYKTFRTKVRKSAIDTSRFASDGIVKYKTIFGDELTAHYGKGGTVNGSTPPFPSGMLFSSPAVSSKFDSGIMRIEGKNTILTLDMNSGTATRESRK